MSEHDPGLTEEQRRELLEGGYSEEEVDRMEREAEREAALEPIHDEHAGA